MAFTAMGALQPEQKRAWIKESIRAFRENSFFTRFMGKGENSIVQQITELTKTEKGDRAMIGLVAELGNSGVVGDNTLEGREEAMDSSWQEIVIDQLRKATMSKGRVDDQKSVFDFRKESRDKLAYWRARIMDELMILTASGIAYSYNTNGTARAPSGPEDDLNTLSFAGDVTAPTSNRHFAFNGTSLVAGDTTAITSGYVPKYGMIVDLMAEAQTRGVKPIRIGGKEYRVFLCHPKTFAALKKDADFRDAIINAGDRGKENPVFTGAVVTMDGAIIHTNNRVFNTLGAASGSKWGAGGAVNGTRSLLLGAQALAYADIWGNARWDEDEKDYGARWGIAVASMVGILKPVFKSQLDDNTSQDFGVMCCDIHIG